jgi:class 3 adenylate cyclase
MGFRSEEATSGFARKPGIIHAHIDAGGAHRGKVAEIVKWLASEKFPSKDNEIIASSPGSHRNHPDFRRTYANHTPGTPSDKDFGVFSTTSFPDHSSSQVAAKVKEILNQLSHIKGVVVEVERVLGVITKRGEWEGPLAPIPSIDESEVGYEALYTHPVEIHLAFDLDKEKYSTNTKAYISPEEVCELTDKRGLKVGEWFLFDKGKHWSYRSSQFLEIDGYEEIAQDYHTLMGECLRDRFSEGINWWTLTEQILGLWKTQFSPSIENKYESNKARRFGSELTLPQLGRWERSFQTLETFWGVVPNFLGDTNPDICDAMLFNLRERGTTYTYFLHSFADLQRLRDFTDRLQYDLRRADLSEQIRPVLLWQRPGKRNLNGPISGEYFIANPTSGNSEGYKIIRNASGHVTHGVRLSESECERAVEALSPLLNRTVQGICPPVIVSRSDESVGLAIAYTDLEDSVKTMLSTPASIWDDMLEHYDRLVATETSRVAGEVIKALGDGYLLAFPNPKAAFDFAVRIQKAVDQYNDDMISHHNAVGCVPRQRIALDYGQVRRVERSHGYDLAGVVLSRCARVVAKVKKGNHIVMTKEFQGQLADALAGLGESDQTIRPLGRIPMKGFKEYDVELFELIWRNRKGIPIEPLELNELIQEE